MPQTIGKNIWKYNSRLQPSELILRTNNAKVKLKNSVIEEAGIVEGEEIECCKIKKSEDYKWKIQATKEEVEELKLTTEILPKISMQCIKIVTEERPRMNIVFRRPGSLYERDMVVAPEKGHSKYHVHCRPHTATTSTKQREFLKHKTNSQQEDSILLGFNPTKFNPRRVKSSTPFHRKDSMLSETENETGFIISFARRYCRPFTANSYRTEVEAQARSKSKLEILNKERFGIPDCNQQRMSTLKESKENFQELEIRVRKFCEDIEQFKRKTILLSGYHDKQSSGSSFDKGLNQVKL